MSYRTIDMGTAQNIVGQCGTCGDDVIQAQLDASMECSRCGDSLYENMTYTVNPDGTPISDQQRCEA